MDDVGSGALVALLLFIGISGVLGIAAQRVVQRGEFLKGYFLGNRSLGAWALALTATVQSGGTFMGFPSYVYSHGWVVALWICGYMVVPISGFAVIGKRVAQLSRRTAALTLPDLFRERFNSPALGLASSLLVITILTVMMVAQFKAGALVIKVALPKSVLAMIADPAADQPAANQSNTIAQQSDSKPAKTEDAVFYFGLVFFTVTVVGYTLFGGFLAAVWTDLFQSIMMLVGVIILFLLAVPAAGGLENATRQAVAHTGDGFALPPGYATDGREFLPITLALSFFVIWPFNGFSSPASVVRLMACRDTLTIRRSIVVLGFYNFLIYLPLVAICICARALMPDLVTTDEVVPRMAMLMTSDLWGGSWIAGLILAAPFGAIMATVSTLLVVVASGLVRDIYQRFLRPHATEREIRLITYALMVLVGAIAVAANIRPVRYLQVLVVFSGTCAAASFLVPLIMSCYWRRATAAGTLASMLAGASTMFGLFTIGLLLPDPLIGAQSSFRPYYFLGMDPVVWGLLVSLIAGVVVSLVTKPPDTEFVDKAFGVGPLPA